MNNNKLDYRLDIEGLRALAVLSVVLFHTDWLMFSGGYVGVDIFLVISGFLITRIIYNKLDTDSFSLKDFYIKRARRLIPALLVTLSLSSIAAFLLFTPIHFKRFGGSLLSSTFSVANFFFLSETGYFNTESMFKPLLHTWSLSIEEQFYLIWPLTIYLLFKFSPKKMLYSVLTIGLTSFILNGLYISSKDMIFFLLPFRVFEFCLGAMLTWINTDRIQKKWIFDALLVISLILMIPPIFLYDNQTIFPFYNALPPCLGAALFILTGNKSNLSKLFNNSPMVYIGRLSYSWYLVHWPVFIFYKYWHFKEVNTLTMSLLVIASFGLATLLHKTIEQPFRLKESGLKLSGRAFAAITLISLTSITFFGLVTWKEKWGNKRQLVNTTSQKYKKVIKRLDCVNGYGVCNKENSDSYDAILVGDSHSNFTFIYSIIASHTKQKIKAFPGISACFPLFNNSLECETEMNKRLNSVINDNVKSVFLASNWSIYTHQYKSDWLFKKIGETIKKFRSNNINVYVWGSMPFLSRTPAACFDRPLSRNKCETQMVPIDFSNQIKFNNNLKKIVTQNGGRYFDLFKELCSQESCTVAYEQRSLYADRYHINERNFGGYLYMKYFHTSDFNFDYFFEK